MSQDRISFVNHVHALQELFDAENVKLPAALFQDLLLFLSRACTYEEEERKIRPSLILCANLAITNLVKFTQATFIPLVKEPINSIHLSKRLKSILPFCNNGWRVLINIESDYIIYGIIRNFNGPSGMNIEDILMTLSDQEQNEVQINYVLIDVLSNFDILLKGNKKQCNIDFRLVEDKNSQSSTELFCEDLLSAYDCSTEKERIAYSKIIKLFSQKLHGSICVMVQHDYELPDEILKDGIFLETPIDIYSVLSEELRVSYDIRSTISAHEKYHAYTGLLLEMLNIDGITVVDNKGRIRGYNVFVKPDTSSNDALAGGARKRAAQYLLKQQNPNYIGVYFQSQDGMSSYERIDKHG